MFIRKTVSPIFYASTVFILIPIFNALELAHPSLLIVSSVLFLLSYLMILHTNSKVIDIVCWAYLIFYILLTMRLSAYMAYFLLYLINLLTWHYQEKSFISGRTVSMWLTVVISLCICLLSSIHYVNKFVIVSTILMSVVAYVAIKVHDEQESLKNEVDEQNHLIASLLLDNEKNRISQDLHDTLGHVFAALTIKSDLALALLQQGDYALVEKELKEIQEVSSKEMRQVRQLIEGLQQRTIEEELVILKKMLDQSNVQLIILMSDGMETVPDMIQNHVAMMLRELTNNLLKHSQATICQLKITVDQQCLYIHYEDNGVGFEDLRGDELETIKNRLVLLKGQLVFHSLQDPTQIELVIPLEVL